VRVVLYSYIFSKSHPEQNWISISHSASFNCSSLLKSR